jgi:YggT family protein
MTRPLLLLLLLAPAALASVVLPPSAASAASSSALNVRTLRRRSGLAQSRRDRFASLTSGSTSASTSSVDLPLAMAIPGYGIAEQIFVGGFGNFIQAYNAVITARILLSWFPQAQSIGALQPVFAITDPYLNLFRGIIPPVFGLDLSPLLAFFALNLATQATAAVGADLPPQQPTLRQLQRQQQQEARGVRLPSLGRWGRRRHGTPTLD